MVWSVIDDILTDDESRIVEETKAETMNEMLDEAGLEVYPASKVPGLIQPVNL